ncbi:proton-coupled folate transporter [Procambarus clarkii]|uniref:proton-coupled folate transporter n=1 Tax=Procambarus clarkii TaxID=6728 RepID=UPI001E6729F5|nr:proton-coupled folate transporter-like [Procambarus clarkii]XP_045613413.1 proton-coupled folate transporter-like [Procambarus clarkii]
MAIGCKVTVEPVLFLYMLAVFMLHPALQDLIYTKVCLQDYNQGICDNLYAPENHAALNTVQTGSSHWVQGSVFMLAVPSIVTAQFLGSWSDTYGRKIPMLLPPVGAMFASLLYIIMSVHLNEIPVSVILLASFISGICGGFTSCIMTCMSYVAQVSSFHARTVRVGILESMIFVGGTIGPLLGGWVQKVGGRSSTFTFIMTCHAAVVIYIVTFVRNIPPRHPPQNSWIRSGCTFQHLRECAGTVVKERQEKRRTYLLWLLTAATIIMICTAGEMDISYLYVKDTPIQWPFEKYTWYFSLKYGLGALALIGILPFCSKVPDMILALIGLTSKLVGLVLLGIAWEDTSVFVSAALAMLSTWPLPTLRSAMSKLVEPNEQGKLFACVALLENACTLVASGVFNSVYPATRLMFRGFTFIMAAGFLILPIIILSVLQKALKQFSKYDSVELAEEAREEFEELDCEREPSPTVQEEVAQSQEESGLVTEGNTENSQIVRAVDDV